MSKQIIRYAKIPVNISIISDPMEKMILAITKQNMLIKGMLILITLNTKLTSLPIVTTPESPGKCCTWGAGCSAYNVMLHAVPYFLESALPS